ncbi:hypothetical protein H4R24_001106 [Coemansia sp. RSA 988]|nr:hypothetical protein H4R24_001106 [Coemansia sp. RSA 988]
MSSNSLKQKSASSAKTSDSKRKHKDGDKTLSEVSSSKRRRKDEDKTSTKNSSSMKQHKDGRKLTSKPSSSKRRHNHNDKAISKASSSKRQHKDDKGLSKVSSLKRRHKDGDKASSKSRRKHKTIKAPAVETIDYARASDSAPVNTEKELQDTPLVSGPLPFIPKATEADNGDANLEKEFVDPPSIINTGDAEYASQHNPTSEPSDYMSSTLKIGSRSAKLRYGINSGFENALDRTADRTMYAITSERDRDITRQIVLGSEANFPRPSQLYPIVGNSAKKLQKDVLCWPNTNFYRYLNSGFLNNYKPLSNTILRDHWSTGIPIALEEPGMEWDMQELGLQPNNSIHEQAPFDDVDISDPSVNGGTSLIIRRRQGSDESPTAYTAGNVEYLTKQHLMHSKLQAPRYSRVPLQDQFCFKPQTSAITKHHQPLVDMTRAQVLNQILKLDFQSEGRSPLPLSKFVSCTVAEEAVSGILQTWSNTSEFCKSAGGTEKEVFPGMAVTQWVSVLQNALTAGLPPDVVARAYRRLEKLCDVLVGDVANKARVSIKRSAKTTYRKYLPKKDTIKENL